MTKIELEDEDLDMLIVACEIAARVSNANAVTCQKLDLTGASHNGSEAVRKKFFNHEQEFYALRDQLRETPR